MLVGSHDVEEVSFFLLLISMMNFTRAFFDAMDLPFGEDGLSIALSGDFLMEDTIFNSSYFSFACNSLCLSSITCFSLSSLPHFVNS